MRHAPAASAEATAGTRELLGSAALVIATVVVSLGMFRAFWHRDALADLTRQPGGWLGAIAIVACSAVAHELLHAITWYTAARLPWRAIAFRPGWRTMGFVASPDVPIPARAYRAGLAAPALVLAAVPIVVGLAGNLGLLVLWGLFALLECFSDVATLLATRSVPGNAAVRSHPEKLGCITVAL